MIAFCAVIAIDADPAMTSDAPSTTANPGAAGHPEDRQDDPSADATILCRHCRRTAENGLRCLGMCVADSEY
jgi:hypothetical protein